MDVATTCRVIEEACECIITSGFSGSDMATSKFGIMMDEGMELVWCELDMVVLIVRVGKYMFTIGLASEVEVGEGTGSRHHGVVDCGREVVVVMGSFGG